MAKRRKAPAIGTANAPMLVFEITSGVRVTLSSYTALALAKARKGKDDARRIKEIGKELAPKFRKRKKQT